MIVASVCADNQSSTKACRDAVLRWLNAKSKAAFHRGLSFACRLNRFKSCDKFDSYEDLACIVTFLYML